MNLKSIYNITKDLFKQSREFNFYHNQILIERIKYASIVLILTYPCFFFVDVFLLNGFSNKTYRFTLMAVHLTGFIISIIYLVFYKRIRDLLNTKNQAGAVIIAYVFIYILLGATASVNSQLFTGNITAYLIILIAVAAIFPIKPAVFFSIVMGNQIPFIILLFVLQEHNFTTIIKQVNSTGTAIIALIISFAFYTYKKRDFFNQIKIKTNEENFRKLFEINPQPLVLISFTDNHILLVNKQAADFFNVQKQYPLTPELGHIFNDEEEKTTLFNRLKVEKTIKGYLVEQHLSSGQTRWSLIDLEIVDYDDEPSILMGIIDVTAFKQKESELFEQASTDELTGIMTRRIGLQLLENHLNHFPNHGFIICYMDINNLKMVNDTFGHKIGDMLIKSICEVIKNQLDDGDLFFRQGGDEFIIVFFEKLIDKAEEKWRQIESEFHTINQSNQKPYPLSVSHGYYQYKPGSNVSLEDMLSTADGEMYKEKIDYQKKAYN